MSVINSCAAILARIAAFNSVTQYHIPENSMVTGKRRTKCLNNSKYRMTIKSTTSLIT